MPQGREGKAQEAQEGKLLERPLAEICPIETGARDVVPGLAVLCQARYSLQAHPRNREGGWDVWGASPGWEAETKSKYMGEISTSCSSQTPHKLREPDVHVPSHLYHSHSQSNLIYHPWSHWNVPTSSEMKAIRDLLVPPPDPSWCAPVPPSTASASPIPESSKLQQDPSPNSQFPGRESILAADPSESQDDFLTDRSQALR